MPLPKRSNSAVEVDSCVEMPLLLHSQKLTTGSQMLTVNSELNTTRCGCSEIFTQNYNKHDTIIYCWLKIAWASSTITAWLVSNSNTTWYRVCCGQSCSLINFHTTLGPVSPTNTDSPSGLTARSCGCSNPWDKTA